MTKSKWHTRFGPLNSDFPHLAYSTPIHTSYGIFMFHVWSTIIWFSKYLCLVHLISPSWGQQNKYHLVALKLLSKILNADPQETSHSQSAIKPWYYLNVLWSYFMIIAYYQNNKLKFWTELFVQDRCIQDSVDMHKRKLTVIDWFLHIISLN